MSGNFLSNIVIRIKLLNKYVIITCDKIGSVMCNWN